MKGHVEELLKGLINAENGMSDLLQALRFDAPLLNEALTIQSVFRQRRKALEYLIANYKEETNAS